MMYKKRNDGRKFDELRPMEAKVGVVKRADGSAMFKVGNTYAIAAVYGPRELHPKFLQNPQKGVLRCEYNMMAFSGAGERVRPGTNRRSKEISFITEKALLPVLDMSKYPKAVIDVCIELIQTDAGTRCAGICAAAMALAHAGIPMRDLPAAVSVGIIEDQMLADITSHEDCELHATDIPVCILPRTGDISLLQVDGFLSKQQLNEAIIIARKAVKEINKVQVNALKNSLKGEAL